MVTLLLLNTDLMVKKQLDVNSNQLFLQTIFLQTILLIFYLTDLAFNDVFYAEIFAPSTYLLYILTHSLGDNKLESSKDRSKVKQNH